MTGGRIKRLQKFINEEPFMLTYGDGLANINIKKLLDFHYRNKKLVTMTAVRPTARFGELELESKSKSVFDKNELFEILTNDQLLDDYNDADIKGFVLKTFAK